MNHKNNMNDNTGRVVYLDYLRLIATIGVVIIHVALTFTSFNDSAIDARWRLVNIIESFVRWSVPVFVMISGVSFLNLKQELTLKELYKKYIGRLFLALVCWNVFYFLCSCGAACLKGNELPGVTRLLTPYGHLWFLPMMIGVYMVLPFLRSINERGWGGYFLLLWASYLTITNLNGEEYLKPFLFTMCLGYPGYFLLGSYLHSSKRINEVRPFVWVLAFMASVVLIMVFTRYCTGGGVPRVKFYAYVTPLVMISAAAVFMLLKRRFSISWVKKSFDCLLFFSRQDLFGIFLIHLFWIDIISHISMVDSFIHNNIYYGIPLMTIIVLLLSLLSTKLLRLIPLINKLV